MINYNVFLDCGAFSAMNCGKTIDVYKYIDFIKEHKEHITVYANLDIIGDAEATWKHQEIMEAAGLNPIPVYSGGSPIKYLYRAMEYPYFALGNIANLSGSGLRPQLNELFSHICPKSNNYFPVSKVHGFGCTDPGVIIEYPWWSVDSSTWLRCGTFGIIMIPKIIGGIARYDKPPIRITVSNRSRVIKEFNHFNNLPKMDQEVITKYFTDYGFTMGKSVITPVPKDYELQEDEVFVSKLKTHIEKIEIPGLSNCIQLRDKLNLLYFLNLEKNQPEYPWAWTKKRAKFLF